MKRRTAAFLAALWTGMFAAPPAEGQTASTEASRRFQAGLAQVSAGDIAGALREFELAYAAQPHFSVQYNIGQAHSALGHPVEAASAFERYLSEGERQVPDARRAEVEALLAMNRQRVGQLRAHAPTGAHVWLDGIELRRARLDAPLSVGEGRHTLLVSVGPCPPTSREIDVQGGRTIEVDLAPPTDCPPRDYAPLLVTCAVPDVQVEVGGHVTIKTPVAHPLRAPVGRLQIAFQRRGYERVAESLEVVAGQLNRVDCRQRPARVLGPELRGYLRLTISPDDASTFVDGQRFDGRALPAGRHQLRLERAGFVPQESFVTLMPGVTLHQQRRLVPTTHTQREQKRRKAAGLALAGIALGTVGGALGLYAWNGQRYDAWRAAGPEVDKAVSLNRALSIQRVDDLALGLVACSVGFAAGGFWLFFGGD